MIRTDYSENILKVTFDRPERRNALSVAGLDELEAAITNGTAPVVYLTGAGEAFCAGADLDTVSELGREEAAAFARRGQRVTAAIESYDGVVVAGIDGATRGGGVELALACDLRIGTPDATLAESGVSLGLFGAWGGTRRLPQVVGDAAALDLALTGRVVDATEAKEIGLLTQIVDQPHDVAKRLAENDATAMRTIKQLLRDREPQPQQERRETEAFADLISAFERE